jgi:uncharacterized paraquat-inducible protein A
MGKLKSILQKGATLLVDGLEPYEVGKNNFKNPIPEIESLAWDRLEICVTCRYFKKEPVEFLRVIDERIKALSEMSCGKCGCELSYKTRQSIKTCSKWQNKE